MVRDLHRLELRVTGPEQRLGIVVLTSLRENLGASAKHNPAELLPILIVAIDDDGNRWVFGNIAQALERGAARPFRLLVDGDVERIPCYREAHRHDVGNCATISGGEMTNPLLGENGLAGVGVHTLAMLTVTAAIAATVYEWVGVEILRRVWLNADLIWTLALLATGALLVPA